ncbi:hypothetical protein DMB95_01525 [Campylobacter sp. MIT 12-8780]|uniref:thioredoxin fold domain-containing protein n=1 Tax=unclassified Campylobacter TaxID=2593542 RepID=UPI00115D0F32|nr:MULTISPECIES: thioredoxin fold domain-containing protein [unclassified Campylobacter]NDJ28134.1 thioredoxin fold domain-containing protein [Campylobacter sp. MIT 19-121]TQR42321.1 hypothetical protein DMB95_01525 [Campylobacter sp. MIT 12-8780]
MKKLLSLSALTLSMVFSQAFADKNDEAIKFYTDLIKMQVPNAKVSVLKKEKLENSNITSVELSIKVGEQSTQDIIFVQDDFIFPEVIDVKQKRMYRQEYEMTSLEQQRAEFSQKAKAALKNETQIITLGDKNKPVLYVFSDPECPYCRAHLAGIEEELKENQLKLIITPVHGKSAFEKTALIYKESKNAKTDAQKIAILRKYYDENIKNYDKVSQKELNTYYALFEKYQKLGLRSVPTLIKE